MYSDLVKRERDLVLIFRAPIHNSHTQDATEAFSISSNGDQPTGTQQDTAATTRPAEIAKFTDSTPSTAHFEASCLQSIEDLCAPPVQTQLHLRGPAAAASLGTRFFDPRAIIPDITCTSLATLLHPDDQLGVNTLFFKTCSNSTLLLYLCLGKNLETFILPNGLNTGHGP